MTAPGKTCECFNPDRLDVARRRRGLSKHDLAVAVGVSTSSMYAYTTGRNAPSNAVLEEMGRVLHFPVSFFSGPSLEEPPNLGHYG